MFLSDAYVYLQEKDEKDENYLNISVTGNDVRQRNVKQASQDEQTLFDSKVLSKSENDVSKLKQKHKNQLYKFSTSHSYDADTDTDPEDDVQLKTPPSKVPIVLQCEICHLEYTSCHEDKFNMFYQSSDETRSLPYIDAKKLKKIHRRRSQKSSQKPHHKVAKINFEDYKDWSHRMEEFSADAERKWTLKYQHDQNEDQPKLTKIIIGRGQSDDYPELNNVHLLEEVKRFKVASWRNDWLTNLTCNNEKNIKKFALYPTTNTCLFCFEERCTEISMLLKQGLPLIAKAKTLPTGTELNIKAANGVSQKLENKKNYVETNGTSLQKSTGGPKLKNIFGKLKTKSIKDKKMKEVVLEDDDDDEEFTLI